MLRLEGQLTIEYASHCYQLSATNNQMELSIPNVQAAAALLKSPGSRAWVKTAEQILGALHQRLKVTYAGFTLITLGAGGWPTRTRR